MIVIAIIGILAAIAIPSFISYKQHGYDATAVSDAKNAYIMAQGYFSDYPSASALNLSKLIAYGYVPSTGVTVAVSGSKSTLAISSSHGLGAKTYTVDPAGALGF